MRELPISWRIVVWFQLLEAPFFILLAVGWAALLAVDLWTVLLPATLISGARWLLTGWHLRVLMKPVDGWREALAAGDERPLLAAHAALQRMPTAMTIGFASEWIIAYVVATAYVWFAMYEVAPIGYEELVAFALLQLSTAAGSSGFCFPVTTMLIAGERAAVSQAIAARGVRVSIERASLATRLIALLLAYVVASAAMMASVGWANNTAFNRHDAASALAVMALQDVQRVAKGLTPVHGQVVDASGLPVASDVARLHDHPEFEGLQVMIDRRAAHASIAAPLDANRWVLVEGPITAHGNAFQLLLLLFGLVVGLWGVLTAVLNTRALVGPLVALETSMRRLVGVGDILAQAPLSVIEDDEIGVLTRCYNDLLATLRELAEAAQVIARGHLTITLEHRGDLHDTFRAMVDQLDSMVGKIRETSLDVSSTTAEIYAAAQEQEQAAARNAAGVGDVRTTVASLAGAALDITSMSNIVRDNAVRTLEMTDTMADKISELSAQANGISDLLELIREIADRSDLLALNGSLEATRAGEAGHGFALLAVEMRRLAERVTQTVADMRSRVASMEAVSRAAVMATEENRKLAHATVIAARQIAAVTQQQSEGTARAGLVVDDLAAFLSAASAATTRTRAAAESLRRRTDMLDHSARRFATRTQPGSVTAPASS